MDSKHKPGEQQTDPGAGPEEAFRINKAAPGEQDAEGHGIRFGKAIPDDEAPGPDEAVRWRGAVPDEQDAEGHGVRWGRATPDEDPGPDAGVRLKVDGSDDETPGPDDAVKWR